MAQTKAKTNSVLTSTWTGNILELNVLGVGELKFDSTKASAVCTAEATRNGWLQRLSDKAALKAPVRAAGTTEEAWQAQLMAHRRAKHAAIETLISHYESGSESWPVRSGGTRETSSMLAEALMELWGKPREAIVKFLASKDAAYRRGLALSDNVRPIIAKLEAAKVTVIVDTDSALAEYEAMTDATEE